MAEYVAPLADMRFALDTIASLGDILKFSAFADHDRDTIDAVLEEAGKFATGILSPINVPGDRQGATLENGVVRTADGFKDAYHQFREAGWNGPDFDPEHGGGGLPYLVGTVIQEMVAGANMSFSLCPLLTHGAIEAISAHGTEQQKTLYLPKMISGEWTGTMNLTEPHAGSDVGALRSKAVPNGDGTYKISGTKIFITFGEHDMADNIVHLVLARLPDAPAGTKGISLFIVPKFLPDKDGKPGARNDLRCVSLEHKLGIHASPTCVMSYGDNGGATGWLLGAENQGMRCMFTMMNAARLAVGNQGVAIAERAYQHALHYARDRRQGRPLGHRGNEDFAIIAHPDVRRNLMLMRSQTEAARALVLLNASCIDMAHHHPDAGERARAKHLVELLTPLSKSWSTDIGCEVASIGVQIHGGMGFIEETGAAQYQRDARILPIYEGTNGIQAIDLVVRKLPLQDGGVVRELLAAVAATQAALSGDLASIKPQLKVAHAAMAEATEAMLAALKTDANAATGGATPYLRMLASLVGGWLLARQAIEAQKRIASGDTAPYLKAKIASARFFADQVLSLVPGMTCSATAGISSVAENASEELLVA